MRSPQETTPFGWRTMATLVLVGLGSCQAAPAPGPQPPSSDAAQPFSMRPPHSEGWNPVPQEPGPGEAWSLAEILQRIQHSNPDLARMQAALSMAQAGVSIERADFAPELSLVLDYANTNNPVAAFGMRLNQERVDLGPSFDATPGGTENWRKELRLDWALWKPGRAARLQGAQAAEEGARASARDIDQKLRNAGIQAWFGLRAAREMQQVLDASIQVVAERLEQTERRYREGAALKADVLRLKVRLAEAKQEAAQAKLSVATATSGLNRLMDRDPLAELALKVGMGPDWGPLQHTAPLEELITEAIGSRQDVAAARHRVRTMEFGEQSARQAGGLQVSAFGSYGYDGTGLGIDSDLDSYMLGVGVRLPFSKRTGANQAMARAGLIESRAALRSLVAQVAHEVSDAREAIEVAQVKLELASTAVETAQEAYRITAEAQDAGGATVTDVLEAQDARKKAQVAHVAAQFQVEIAHAKLARAVGKLP